MWGQEPGINEIFQVPELLARTAQLKKRGLTMQRVAFSFMKRRVQPLMQRSHPGFEYLGAEDPSRMTKDSISDDEVMVRLTKIFHKMEESVPQKVLEFSAQRPPKPVSTSETAVLLICRVFEY